MGARNRCDADDRLCKIVSEMAGAFKVLGDLTRLKIIYLLATDTTGKLGVSDLAERLGISQPAASQHLKTLKGVGIVESRREGLYVYHTINRDRMVTLREYLDQMYASVMDTCDREMVRRTIRSTALNACVVYYSYTGVTRNVARQIQSACSCDLVEVKTQKDYSTFTAYTTGVLRSRKGACDPIVPEEIDVSPYDLLIIGTPVWAWKPAPPINAAVKALSGCEGKKAVVFVTCCGQPGEALPLLRKALASRGVEVVTEISLTQEDVEIRNADTDLIGRIVEAYPLRDSSEEAQNRTENGDERP
ncbi:metalloregulator ArsR/SmtB family transcription factor [Methanofollis ethanolicus]|uniref:metalloregulator ArsR/SmtB family transcription factor n=1 Tax=Methanofollis ethanolicus TaxID=488124 RepID=UPI000829D28D|nr:metalloregulator ArsR/SmtB family transcription factor [Methanofollis ethanolicus]